MISENDNNILARWMTYGIVVRDNEDSGWQITGRSPGLLDERCYQLEAFTSAGQVSENWANIFGNGYGYFGEFKNDAVFAHFYRSDIKSARGRYFVPRSILLIPYKEYIDKLHCDPITVFKELKKHKPGSYRDISEAIELAPIKIPVPETRIEFPLTALEKIPGTQLMDFLSCVLQPEPLDTIIWGGEQPDVELLFSLLFLLPRTLRKFITFCTCVESLHITKTRVKIVRDLSPGSGNSSLIIIKDKTIDVREKRIHKHTLLPDKLVRTFRQGIGALNRLHQHIDSQIELLHEANFETALERTETLCHKLTRQIQIDAIPDPGTKYRELVSFGLQSKKIGQEREFIVNQIENGIKGFKTGESTGIQDQLVQLLKMLDPIRPPELEGFAKRFWEAAEEAAGTGQISGLLPLLKLYISIPLLKEAIMSNFFEKLALVKISRWDEAFEILSLIQTESQLDQLNKNAELLTQLKQHKEAELFLVLLDLIFMGKEPSWEFLESIADEIDADTFFDIFKYGLKCFENLKEENPNLLFFLLAVACMYPNIPGLPQKQPWVFENLFIKAFSRAIFSQNRHKAGDMIKQILEKIGPFNQVFKARLNAVFKRRTLIDNITNLANVLSEENILSFAKNEDAKEFFQLLDSLNRKTAQPLNLVSIFFNLTLYYNTVPSSLLLQGYVNYLQEKQKPGEVEIQILMAALTKDPSPLENPDFFLDIFSLVFKRCKGELLIKCVHLLLMSAKKFIRKNDWYLKEISLHVEKILAENWHPQGINEVREIYQAVSSCFDIVMIHTVLEFGLSRCLKDDTGKKAWVLGLVKRVKNFLVFAGNDDPFELILNNIKDVNNQYVSINIDDLINGIKKKYGGNKEALGMIDSMLKGMRKAK